jgi:hypothetical protein
MRRREPGEQDAVDMAAGFVDKRRQAGTPRLPAGGPFGERVGDSLRPGP